jgi:peroxiredoxin
MLRKQLALSILVACVMWMPARTTAQQTVGVGSAAPDFKLPDLNGKEVRSSQLRGSVVVLDLWATWCEPCLADIPMFNRLHEKFESRGVKVIGIAVESGWTKDIKLHVGRLAIKYPVLVGNDKIVEQYQMIGFPTTYLIGKDGKIAKKYTGTVPDTDAQKEAELNRVIEKLLDGR